MPRNRSKQRLQERRDRVAARQNDRQAQLKTIQDDEEGRLCDICELPKWECEILNGAPQYSGDPRHIYSPMSAERQLALAQERAMHKQHFTGANHPSNCSLPPKVCYITSGI